MSQDDSISLSTDVVTPMDVQEDLILLMEPSSSGTDVSQRVACSTDLYTDHLENGSGKLFRALPCIDCDTVLTDWKTKIETNSILQSDTLEPNIVKLVNDSSLFIGMVGLCVFDIGENTFLIVCGPFGEVCVVKNPTHNNPFDNLINDKHVVKLMAMQGRPFTLSGDSHVSERILLKRLGDYEMSDKRDLPPLDEKSLDEVLETFTELTRACLIGVILAAESLVSENKRNMIPYLRRFLFELVCETSAFLNGKTL